VIALASALYQPKPDCKPIEIDFRVANVSSIALRLSLVFY